MILAVYAFVCLVKIHVDSVLVIDLFLVLLVLLSSLSLSLIDVHLTE